MNNITAVQHESTENICDDCGAQVESITGCPDGAEVCADCADNH